MAVFGSLDSGKRATVGGVLSAQNPAGFPGLGRMAGFKQTPRPVARDDLKQTQSFCGPYSKRQLEKGLVDFWYNHFNVDIGKTTMQSQNLVHVLAGNYERDAIRPHVFGHFKDLLLATARHPAMLYYLDNWESMSPTEYNVGPFAPRRGNVK